MNFPIVQVKIRTVQDTDSTKSGEILRQYKVILLTNKVNFWTVRVKVGTPQDADSAKLGNIWIHYKVISSCVTR